jgi:cyclophilin family peptidyl-prolyl cis-trans isomerase
MWLLELRELEERYIERSWHRGQRDDRGGGQQGSLGVDLQRLSRGPGTGGQDRRARAPTERRSGPSAHLHRDSCDQLRRDRDSTRRQAGAKDCGLLTFHRAVPGFVIQGGDPNGNGTGGPGYHVTEPPPSDLQYTQGVVAMAKAQTEPPGTSGSQFFIVTGANANLPPQYALVGRVVAGQHAAQAISQIPTEAGPDGEKSAPSRPIVIEKATLSVR